MLKKLIFIFIIIGFIFRAFILKDTLFYDWDEGIYAEVASELHERGTIQTTFNNQVWHNKPPLSHYIISAFMFISPDPELGARLVMVMFALLALYYLYRLTVLILHHYFSDGLKKMNENERDLVVMIPVMLTSSATIFIERSTQLNTDVLLGAFWMGYLLYLNSYRFKLVFIFLGTWSKSLLGLYPLGIEFLRIRKKSMSVKGLKRGLGYIVIGLSWHILNLLLYKSEFVNSHLMDQLFKRVTDPIELHYGGRLYYVKLAWENFGVFVLLFVIAYIVIACDALGIKKISDLKPHAIIQKIQRFLHMKNWDMLLILLSPVPFFIFLTFVQSKISWYFASIVPLITLSVSYLYMRYNSAVTRRIMIASVLAFLIIRFIPATYALSVDTYQAPDNIKVAQCISTLEIDTVSMLVNAQERQNRNVLEAAQQQTATSFIYGGSPSFVYYTEKNVQYFYKIDDFLSNIHTSDVFVISKNDREVISPDNTINQLFNKPIKKCYVGEWEVYEKP